MNPPTNAPQSQLLLYLSQIDCRFGTLHSAEKEYHFVLWNQRPIDDRIVRVDPIITNPHQKHSKAPMEPQAAGRNRRKIVTLTGSWCYVFTQSSFQSYRSLSTLPAVPALTMGAPIMFSIRNDMLLTLFISWIKPPSKDPVEKRLRVGTAWQRSTCQEDTAVETPALPGLGRKLFRHGRHRERDNHERTQWRPQLLAKIQYSSLWAT